MDCGMPVSLSFTNSRSLLKLKSIESVMPSNHLVLCHPLLQLSIFPSIRVFSNESALCIRWPKYWSFSLIISPSNAFLRVVLNVHIWVISLSSSELSQLSVMLISHLQGFPLAVVRGMHWELARGYGCVWVGQRSTQACPDMLATYFTTYQPIKSKK